MYVFRIFTNLQNIGLMLNQYCCSVFPATIGVSSDWEIGLLEDTFTGSSWTRATSPGIIHQKRPYKPPNVSQLKKRKQQQRWNLLEKDEGLQIPLPTLQRLRPRRLLLLLLKR